MSKIIILNNESNHEIRPVQRQEFFSREVEISDEQYAVLDDVYGKYLLLRGWFAEVYEAKRNDPNATAPALPTELTYVKPAPKKAAPKRKPAAKKPVAKKEVADEPQSEAKGS